MERMTKRTPDGTAYSKSLAPISEHMMMLADRLAAYEDTGLEPDEILTGKELAEIAYAMNLLKEYQGIATIDHLRELSQAEKDGRLVVLPCKVGDKVWQTDKINIYECEIKEIIFDTSGVAFDERAIGKSVFLTRQEAEAALMEEGDNG